MRASVYRAASLISPAEPSGTSHSLLKRTSVRSRSRMRNTCFLYVSAFAAICSSLNGGRVELRPVGSPIIPVKSPIRKMTVWPSSWKRRMRSSGTVWPRCRSGAVGSNPILTRNGTCLSYEFCSLRSRSSRVCTSTAPRVTSPSCSSGVALRSSELIPPLSAAPARCYARGRWPRRSPPALPGDGRPLARDRTTSAAG